MKIFLVLLLAYSTMAAASYHREPANPDEPSEEEQTETEYSDGLGEVPEPEMDENGEYPTEEVEPLPENDQEVAPEGESYGEEQSL